jgi:hypothetical protein
MDKPNEAQWFFDFEGGQWYLIKDEHSVQVFERKTIPSVPSLLRTE